MGQVYYLNPKKSLQVGYVIALYTQEEIDLCVLALNHYAFGRFKVTERDLGNHDPEMIIAALANVISSDVFSQSAKGLAKKIISTVQEMPIRKSS